MIDVDLNNSNELANNNHEDNVQEQVLEPPAKKKRGKSAVYVFMEEVETPSDVELKVKEEGLYLVNTQNQTSYFKCYTRDCSYKWKATVNSDLKYAIFKTEDGHSHGATNRSNGLPRNIKDIIKRRMIGNEPTNPEAILQAARNNGIRTLPTSKQIQNHVAYAKKHLVPYGGDLSFDAVEQMVKEILDDEPDLMDFKYILNEGDPSKTDFAKTIETKFPASFIILKIMRNCFFHK